MDNLNPSFIKSFSVEYRFEERQRFKIKVYDVDDFSPNASLDKHDYVGELEFQLHEVITQRNQQLKKPIQNNKSKFKNNGLIVITADECNDKNNEMLEMQLTTDLRDASNFYFFIISRTVGQHEHVPVYKAENQQLKNGLFYWQTCQILTSTLCKEDDDKPFTIDFFKSAKNGKHKNIGGFQMTLRDIKDGKTTFAIQKGNAKVCLANFTTLRIARRYTFLEYVFGGCQINLSVAIDFTLSNGDPQSMESLHYFDQQRNEYLQAI